MQNNERSDLRVSPVDEPVLEEFTRQRDSSSRASSRGRLRTWSSQPRVRRRALIGAGVAAGAGLWLVPSPLKWLSSTPDIGRLYDMLSADERVAGFTVSGDQNIGLDISMSDETNISEIRKLLEGISSLGGWRGASSSSRGKYGRVKVEWAIKSTTVTLSCGLPVAENDKVSEDPFLDWSRMAWAANLVCGKAVKLTLNPTPRTPYQSTLHVAGTNSFPAMAEYGDLSEAPNDISFKAKETAVDQFTYSAGKWKVEVIPRMIEAYIDLKRSDLNRFVGAISGVSGGEGGEIYVAGVPRALTNKDSQNYIKVFGGPVTAAGFPTDELIVTALRGVWDKKQDFSILEVRAKDRGADHESAQGTCTFTVSQETDWKWGVAKDYCEDVVTAQRCLDIVSSGS